MPAILRQVEEIIVTGNINLAIEKSLNTNQLEEVLKSEWLENNSNMAESLFELEDHDLL